MQINPCWLAIIFLTFASYVSAMQSSNLAGTWVGKVQGYGVEMRFVLRADGSAEYEGVAGSWRAQGNRLLLTQEGETVAYNFTLQGSTLTLSGGDLMAPMVMTRASGDEMTRAPAPGLPESEQTDSSIVPPVQDSRRSAPPAKSMSSPARGKRALSELELTSLLEGGVPSRRLIELVEERGVAFAVNSSSVPRLKAKGATSALIGALQKPEDRSAVDRSGLPSQANPLAGPASGGRAAGGSAPSRGPRFKHDKWGISFVTPAGWKVGERQGLLLMGSDTEAGLIVIRLARKATLEQLIQDYGEGMQEEGLKLMPTMQAQNFAAGQNRAVAGELAGVAQDGARIRARTVAVASPYGDAAVVLGMTTEEKYAGLKPRVESIASSFQFIPPQAPPILEAIAGQWFYISSSSFGSSERYLNLCSDGRFSSQSGTYSSGGAGTVYGEGGDSAQWTAEGDENQGVIVVTFPNGNVERHPYQRSGSDLMVNSRTFARYGDGSCTKSSPVE